MWYNNSWSYRVKVTVLNAKVDADITDYPIYLDLSELPSGFHSHVNQTDGRDIRVTEDDGETEVPREVVFYNSTADTGELHFKGDVLNSTNVDFYIYYGNSGASDYAIDATYGAENVWRTVYKGVWHQHETSGTVVDSTSNDTDSTSTNLEDHDATGQLGKCDEFKSPDDDINLGDTLDLGTNDLTISAWVWSNHTDGSNVSSWIMSKAFYGSQSFRFGAGLYGSSSKVVYGFMQGDGGGDVVPKGSTQINDGSWHLLHYIWNRDGDLDVYVDGSNENLSSNDISGWDGKNFQSINPFRIGAYTENDNTTAKLSLTGLIDEVRVLWSTLSSTQISTEYNNQDDQSTFFTVGAEEVQTKTVTCTTKGRIKQTETSTVTTKARIQQLETETIEAKGGIEKTEAPTISVKAKIIRVYTKTITAKASIGFFYTQTISAKASIWNTKKHIDAKGRIITDWQIPQPTLGSLVLPFPSKATVRQVKHMAKITTIEGKDKKDSLGTKYRYTLKWSVMKPDHFDPLLELVKEKTPTLFTYKKWPQSENGVYVLGKLAPRKYVTGTGTTDYWSEVSLTLTEVYNR